MERAGLKEIADSSKAVEEIFKFGLRLWCNAVGRVDLAKTLRVATSRLTRAISGATPFFDLAYRLHEACALDWADMFTFPPSTPSTTEKVAEAVVRRDVSLNGESVMAAEASVRRRLKDVVGKFGFEKCWAAAGIPRASFHSYLTSTRLPLGIAWKMHLITGISYSLLLDGDEESKEPRLRELVGKAEDNTGRFPDLHEPVVRLAELYVQNEMCMDAGPYMPRLRVLLSCTLSLPQRMRLTRILALYWRSRQDARSFSRIMYEGWRELKKQNVYSELFLMHLAVARHLNMFKHVRDVAQRALGLTDNPETTGHIFSILAEVALERLRVHTAAGLARKALYLLGKTQAADSGHLRARLERSLALCAWLFGDYREALSRTRLLLSSPTTPLVVRRHAGELEMNVRIWLRDVGGAGKALSTFHRTSVSMVNTKEYQVDLATYQLRYLLLKRLCEKSLPAGEERKLDALLEELSAVPESMLWPETMFVRGVSLYLALRDHTQLKVLLAKLVSDKQLLYGTARCALADFVETVKEAGLWSPEAREWEDAVTKQGVLLFTMRRPS